MRRVVVAVFFTMILVKVGAQSKSQSFFKMPPNAKYSKGRVLVKVKNEFKDEVAGLSGNKAASVKNVSLRSIIPAVSPRLDKSSVMRKGARLQNPTVDISKYFSLTFDASQDVEEYINKLYQTGYFEIVEPDYKYNINFTPNDPSISKQYYLNLIKAFDAWDITQGDTSVVIAIVDTGGNLTHEDLKPNLYTNWKEYPPNGVDDDGNGYIDDYRGWDFIGNDTLNVNNPDFIGDNDPSITPKTASNSVGDLSHGTWVAGCASASANNGKGIAGVGFKSRLLFTKHSADNQSATDGSEYNVYGGLLYAGYQKDVKIINCSFGGSGQSQIIQDIINHIVLDLNCVIVAAAGNDGSSQNSYPGAYDNVLSVAATDKNDRKATFSNYGTTIDISAPGVGIYTTQYDNTYTPAVIDGTSFSSPIAAGAAALVWAKNPTFTAVQVREQLRVTADDSFYSINTSFKNRLGKGRVDIKRALTLSLPSVRASKPKLVNQNGFTPVPGQNAFLSFDFTNYLNSTSGGISISISTTSSAVVISKSQINPGIIQSGSTISNKLTPFELTINASAPQNSAVNLLITYTDGSYSDYQYVTFYANPSFIDVNSNQVNTTVTSIGRLGFQDPEDSPPNQGTGFIFNQNSLLFEMGLIMGTSATNLYNNVRGINSGYDQDFSSTVQIKQIVPGERSYSEVFGQFSNSATASQQAIKVDYRSLVWKDSPYDKFVILEYELTNPSANALNSFYFGIFSDWDITTNGQNDAAGWDNNNNLGYVYPAQTAAKPYAGIQVLTGSPGYYAIDNDNTIAGNPFGLYDGYTDTEKFTSVSAAIGSGHERLQAGIKSGGDDVSHVVSSGPFNIAPGQKITIAFALHAAANLSDLQNSARYADSVYNYTLKAVKPMKDSVATCYNSTATLNTSGASKINWYNSFTGGQSFFTGTQYTTGKLLNDTIFYVSNADKSYESVRSPLKVTVLANPQISTSGSTIICQGDTVKLSVATNDVVLWNTGEKTSTIKASNAGKYFVQVKNNSLGCTAKSDTVSVSVNSKPKADFTISGDLQIQSQINFTDKSVGAVTWFWDFGDTQNSSIQNPTHIYTTIKTYTIKLSITSSKGCADTKSNSISVITGIEKMSEPFSVYPNPVTSDYLNIVVPSGLSFSTLAVTDILGRQVSEASLSTQETEQKVYIGNLNDGIYIVRVSSDQGQLTKKILIKR
jgi:hypothetical protein